MSIARISPTFFDQVHLLHDTEKLDPTQVFRTIFEDHRLFELKDVLWDAQEECLLTDHAPFEDSNGRARLIGTILDITRCIEAVKVFVDLERQTPTKFDPNDPAIKYRHIYALNPKELTAAHDYYGRQMTYFNMKALDAAEMMLQILARITRTDLGPSGFGTGYK